MFAQSLDDFRKTYSKTRTHLITQEDIMQILEGHVVTCDREKQVCRYLVEEKGKIKYVGDTLPESYPKEDIVHLGEKSVLPAFVDSHIHFASYAMFAAGLDIRHCRSLEEMQEAVGAYAQKSDAEIIMAFGASAHSVREKRLPTKAEIDAVCANCPVFIVKYDGHACIVNSKLMKILPDGIKKMRGYHALSGEMNQEAFFAVTDFMTHRVSSLQMVRNMLSGVDRLADKGIGLFHSVSGVGFPRDLDVGLECFFGRGQRSSMQMRVFFQTMDISKVLKRKLPRVGGCFATALDGCFGCEDAALHRPYANDPQNRGILFYADARVDQFVKDANRAELQVEMHTVGDAAFDQAVSAIEKALQDYPRSDHRHTLIHACLPTEKGLEKCARLGISIALQPAFFHWDLEPLDYLETILGDRAYAISPLRKMADMGIQMSGGSDAPCSLPDPVFGIYSACNHYVPEQSLTVQEAIDLFTLNGVWTTFDEKERGSLKAGKVADYVILNKNPLALDPKDLLELRIEQLYLAGKAYQSGQHIPSLLWNGLVQRSRKV
jgi:predicted amidohydrolase YtcJ